MSDSPQDRGARPEDRPVDPEAVKRFEQLPDLSQGPLASPRVGPRPGPRSARPAGARNSLVTTAGAVLVAVGGFIAVVSVLAIAPSDGLDLLGAELEGGTAATVFVVLGAVYALTGVLVLLRRPIGRPLGLVVGVLALVMGLAQLPSSGINGIPTVGVAVYVLYALAIGGSDFRRG